MSEKEFFIIIKRVDNIIRAHAIKYGKIDKDMAASTFAELEVDNGQEDKDCNADLGRESEVAERTPYPENFREVEQAFSQAMLMYRNSVTETIRVSPLIAGLLLGINIERVARSRGTRRDDLSSGEIEVYSLPAHAAYSINRQSKQSDALVEGALHLPKISTIGIISSYDAILTDLLRVIFNAKPEIIFTSDREVKFSDIIELGSIEAVRESIIGNEIESVVRQSHHEQFAWMERKFGIKLKEGLDVWPNFIELCERRNLLTHTGGVVSEQYLKNCKLHGSTSDCRIGMKLDVDLDYLVSAINIVSEVGYKLIHTMWRKFAPQDRERADSVLNELGMSLIAAREYKLAEKLLSFGVNQKKHHSDLLRRMMIVNLANAAKLGGNRVESDRILSSDDWSATSYQFQICVAAVRNDFSELMRLMKMGSEAIELTPSHFRDWPVFRDARKNTEVQNLFEQVFGEPLIKVSSQIAPAKSISDESTDNEADNGAKLIH